MKIFASYLRTLIFLKLLLFFKIEVIISNKK